MAGSASKTGESMKKKREKKRKLSNSQVTEKPSKSARKMDVNEGEKEEILVVEDTQTPQNMELDEETPMKSVGAHQWRNLELILSIQNKQLNAHKKVELISEFLNPRTNKADNDTEEFNTLSISRLIAYVSNWIQSLLITSEKKIRAGDKESEESHFVLDSRCWEILRICLKESEILHVPLSLSRDLLRVISCLARSALSSLNYGGIDAKEFSFTSGDFELFSTVNDCLKLLFSPRGRLLNENLDLWAVAVSSLLELVIRFYTGKYQDSGVRNLVIEFSCLVLEPFSKFLRLHPCRKNGFRDLVDKLLEPLLHVLGLLYDQIRDRSPLLLQNFFTLVKEIVSYGLFHSVHLDEYLNLHITDKYSSSADRKMENSRTAIKSYHRHLFDKLDSFVSERKIQSLSGIGELFRLFVVDVKKLRRDTQDAGSLRALDTPNTKHNLISEKSNATKTPASELRKSFFDFFVLALEPLLLDVSKHLQSGPPPGNSLLDVYDTLNSVNRILSSLVTEKAYLRMEDNSGGACLNFLKTSYGLLMSCYARFNRLWLSTWGTDKSIQVEIFKSMAIEFVFMIGCFLEIEYEVIGDDLVSVWLMILTSLTLTHSSEDESELCPLFSRIVELGCRVINLYSELRQVDRAVFALCEGLRHLSFFRGDDEECLELAPLNSFLYYDKFAKSGCLLVSSQKFRLAICNVIKYIPEGQAVDIVQTLSADILGCLEWIKDEHSVMNDQDLGDSHSCRFSAQAKLLGMVFSEIYTLVLDSLPVSAGYSYRMGKSIEELITVLRPSMRHLATLELDGPDEFVFSVLGMTQNKNMECKNTLGDKIPFLLLFFFRIYVSCRSLYRQSLSLMPPDSAANMAKVMADSYTSNSGEDCMKRTKVKDKGYFSWVKSSAPLLRILQFIKDNFFQENLEGYCSLIYVMHMMALQRLVDISRQIHCVEYMLCRSEKETSGTSLDDTDVLVSHKGVIKQKKSKKQEKSKKFLLALKEETFGLTGFIMDFLSIVDEKQQPTPISSERGTNSSAPQYMFLDSWDLGVCTVNENTMSTAIWWIICQNIDIWCNYASKKKLKLFLSVLILNALPYRRFREFEEQSENCASVAMKVTKHQISQELVHDTSFYDQRFVRRYMASRICYVLKKCISWLFYDSKNIGEELGSSDWTNDLRVLQNKAVSARDKPIKNDCAHSDVVGQHFGKGTSSTPANLQLSPCQSLLNLFCVMVDVSLSFKSFSRFVKCLINFERLIIDCLLDSHGSLFLYEHCEFLGLLVSCRRALKYILMAFSVEKLEGCTSTKVPTLSEIPSSTLWLLESVKLVITWWNTLSSQNISSQCNDMIVSLTDQTTYVFFTLCKHQFGSAIHSMSLDRASTSVLDSKGNYSNEQDCSIRLSCDVEAYKSVLMIVEVLQEETKSSLLSLKEAFSGQDGNVDLQSADLKKLSSTVSCIQGFLWGLECALNDIVSNGDDLKVKLMKCKHDIMSRMNSFVNLFLELIDLSSWIFLHNHPGKQGQLNLGHNNSVLGIDASLKVSLKHGSESTLENQNRNSGSHMMTFARHGLQNGSDCRRRKKRLQLDNLHSAISDFAESGSFNYDCLKVDLLGSFFDGQNQDAAFLLRGLFVASSAIVRLSVLIDCSPLSSNLIQNFLGCSEVLMMEFSQMLDFPSLSSFVWLDGTVKFLEAMGIVFASTSPIAAKSVYTKLVELHLKAIGKCTSLQGKGAVLASHIESNTKMYYERRVSESTVSGHLYGLENLKARLRMSFKALVEKSSESLLSSALQVLERALVGRREGFSMIYEIKRESIAEGLVSSMVAGAVDCLDLLLEFNKGKNQLNAVKMHISGIFASLFSIMVHLQGYKVFYTIPNSSTVNKNPDSGSVVLMCVEVLTRIAGKRAQFYLDSCHVGQALHKPATLFKDFCYIRSSQASHQSVIRLDDKEYDELESYLLIDRQFSVNLYAASCRLLWTVVKHRKSECVRSIALLQNSLQVLLRCLEVVDSDSEDRKAYFNWDVEEGVKCASYLRRVYEEIGQQEEVLGQHCFMFLSDYIWLYSGYGPLRRGIKKEVDEALRPGFYALLDVCSADDLQYLHTVFGEGSCRSTLARLKDDHKRQQYEGKV